MPPLSQASTILQHHIPWHVQKMIPVLRLAIVCMIVSGLVLPEKVFADSNLNSPYDSPLQQIRNGVLDSNVRCPGSAVLIFKADDLSPACVEESNVFKLAARGWALANLGPPVHSSASHGRDYALAFLTNAASPTFETTLGKIAKRLKEGDYLIVEGLGGHDPRGKIKGVESHLIQGVHVGGITIYNSISSMTNKLPNLPGGFDYIGYDYEKGSRFSPEFTANESESIGYFDQARKAVAEYNERTGGDAKLLLMPPYGELKGANWDWGLVAQHTDMIDIQLQAFIKDPKFFNYTLDAMAQIKREAPSTKAFIQISLVEKRGTAGENLDAINEIRMLPLDGFFIFYHQNQTSEVDQFLDIMPG